MMKRSCLFVCAVLACVVVSVSGHGRKTHLLGHRAPRIQREIAEIGGPEALSCVECELIMDLVYEVADNQTKSANAEKFLDGLCEKYFPGAANATIESVCEFVVKEVLAVLPTLTQGMTDLGWPHTAACSVLLGACKNPVGDTKKPEQIRLTLTSNPSTEMRVTWVTGLATTTSTVQWGESSLTGSATGVTRTYTSGGWVGVIHTAVMTGLTAGTKYLYRVGDSDGGWSSTMSFSMLPSNAGTAARPLKLIVVADLGVGDNGDATIANVITEVQAGNADVFICVGDFDYSDGYSPLADEFANKMQPITSTIPSYVGVGNHELIFDFEPYRYRYGASNPVPPDGAPTSLMYFKADLPGLSYISLSTESTLDTPYVDPAQMQWLEKELPIARARAPWTAIGGHRALYCSADDKANCVTNAMYLREKLEGLFKQHEVDAVFSGHIHNMELSYPTWNGTVTSNFTKPTAPVYALNGAGGNREGHGKIHHPNPWSAWHDDTHFGYSRVTVEPTKLTYDFMAANATTGPQRLHTFTLTK